MKAPQNRRVVVLGYALSTPLGHGLARTWGRALEGESGTGWLTRFAVEPWMESRVVGEIPDFDPLAYDFITAKDAANWNAKYVLATSALSHDALAHAGLELTADLLPRTGSLVGSALNGLDSYGIACSALEQGGSTKVSPYLLPNVCANMPSGIAGMNLKYAGPVFSPGGACASGNHCITLGSRLIQHGDADVMLVGGVDFPILPPIVAGFQNMNATYKVREGDRGSEDPKCASRPFSHDPRGFVLAEGAAILVLAAWDVAKAHGLQARAEVLGCGMSSDAHHFTKPNAATINRCIAQAVDDAGLSPADIQVVNCHGTSTKLGDRTEVGCLQEVFGPHLSATAITSNKSMLGHSLGAAAAVEAVLSIEGMVQDVVLPTINHEPHAEFMDKIDVVANEARHRAHDTVLNNAFGFGGTNCSVVFRKM